VAARLIVAVNGQNKSDKFRAVEGLRFAAKGRYDLSVAWTAPRTALIPCPICARKNIFQSFSVNYNMTGETNLPTGIIDFLGIKKFINPTWDQFREPREKLSSIGRSRSAFRGRERYVPTRVTGVSVISRSDIAFRRGFFRTIDLRCGQLA
jgi:hypothetical protein